MLFNSAEFLLVFLPVTLAGFLILAFRFSWWATLWLTIASFAFYAYWDVGRVWILAMSIAFNLGAGCVIGRHHGTAAGKAFLIGAIGINLVLLGYFKYAGFFVETANNVFGTKNSIAAIVLPLGISFFTFTQIAFLVDAYRGLVHDYSPVRYALFVTYFPHLIAGPILHHAEMIPQFRKYVPSFHHIAIGLTVFTIGLFKKVVLADSAAVWVPPVFNQPNVTAAEAWGGVLAYTFQIYFDFSGYSDMAIGLSYMFGIKLPINFNSPYKATSIIDFWRRWHITLSRFLRDYLYVPLGGNRKGSFRRYANLLATMAIGGLWHGANWTFVAWGVLHGAYLAINHGWRLFAAKIGISEHAWWRSALGLPITFLSVVVAWVFFRADTFGQAIQLLQSMSFANGAVPPGSIERALSFLPARHLLLLQPWVQLTGLLIALFIIAWCFPNTQEFMATRSAALETAKSKSMLTWRPNFAYALLIACLAVASLSMMSKHSPFLYFQF